MEIDIDLLTLKNLSRDFRLVASRLLRTDNESADSDLERFINFVEGSEVLYNFVEDQARKFDLNNPSYEIKREQRGHSDRYVIPTSLEGEIACTWGLLLGIHKADKPLLQYALGYANFSGKYQDHIDGFNKSVVNPFVNRLNNYLSSLMEEANEGQTNTATVNISGGTFGQFNLAQQASTINAINNQGSTEQDLEKSAKALLEALKEAKLSDEHKEELEEAASFAIEQVSSNKPKTRGLAMYGERVKGVAELLKDSGDIYTRAVGFYTTVEQFISKLPA